MENLGSAFHEEDKEVFREPIVIIIGFLYCNIWSW